MMTLVIKEITNWYVRVCVCVCVRSDDSDRHSSSTSCRKEAES